MVNLFDIVRQAQGGSAMANLGGQFGLSPDQSRLVVEAFLPALTMGLQRSAANPVLFGQILGMMTSGRFAPFFDTASARPADGRDVLDRLFGSPEISGQVASQVAAATGIGVQVMQQMMPAIAAVVMGGLSRFATAEGLADFLRGWSDWLRAMQPPEPAPSRPTGLDGTFAAWTELMGTMMGAKPAPKPAPADPWSAFLQSLATRPGPAPKPPAPPPSKPDPFATLAGMFATGRDVQAQHLASLQAIFDGLRDATTAPR